MRAWPTAPLGDVARLERDIVLPDAIEPGTAYVGLEHIESGGKLLPVAPVANGELKSTKFAFTSEHILYGKLRPYLAKIALPDFSGVCTTEIVPIAAGPRMHRRFLAHFLRQPNQIELATARSTGANLPRLSPSELAKFDVPVPPLAEQRRIAAILDQADALRAKRRAALAQLDELARAIFVEMFGDPAGNPRQWPTVRFGELIAAGPQNGLYKPASDYGSGTPIVRIDAFYDGRITKLASLRRLRISSEDQMLFGLQPGDILINRVNSLEYLGKSALVPELPECTVFESNMMRLSVDRARVLPEYVIQFLQSPFIKQQILASAKNAVNQSSINQQDVRSLRLFVPPMALQALYIERIAELDGSVERQRRSATELDAFFLSLQHRAFRGEL